MTINIFELKGDLNGENRSGAFLFLSGIFHKLFFTLFLHLTVGFLHITFNLTDLNSMSSNI